MSELHNLIEQLCPNGVVCKSLGELGSFYGGLSGKTKTDFTEGNAKFITYMNVYSNPALRVEVSDRVKIGKSEKQNCVRHGDVLFTGSSETPDECGMSSVLTQETSEYLYLNSFCFGYRFKDINLLLPDFSKHLFRSEILRLQIRKTASGVTRFNVSKRKMSEVIIPLPPLPVQQKIVRILDTFTELTKELTTELTAELTARKKQFEYFRDQLLSFNDASTFNWMTLGDVCKNIGSGGTPLKAHADYYGGSIPWLRTQEVVFGEIISVENYITEKGMKNSSAKWIPANCVIVAISGATAARCAINKMPLTTNQHCCNLEINENIALYRYVFHWVYSQYQKLKSLGQGARNDLNVGIIAQYPIPVPPLEEQERIVSILDRLGTLSNDLSNDLPAEIEARHKQYEYYRDKLLTFKEKHA